MLCNAPFLFFVLFKRIIFNSFCDEHQSHHLNFYRHNNAQNSILIMLKQKDCITNQKPSRYKQIKPVEKCDFQLK